MSFDAPGPKRRALLAAAVTVLLTACATPQPSVQPTPTPTPTPTRRDFTVLTAERVTTTDPAAVTTDVGATVALDVFQRLMLIQPGSGQLKPDLASDCLFTSATVYECTIPKGRVFSNGDALTSSDVRFSILRTLRLQVPGTSAGLLNSLERIETPDAQTVRFVLLWPDTQFGYGLASPAASIVDGDMYNRDTVRPLTDTPIGSGPYVIEALDEHGVTFAKSDTYQGPDATDMPRIRLQYTDSVGAEDALGKATTELVWRTLDDAALARLQAQMDASGDQTTTQGYRRWNLSGQTVRRLIWNARSALRKDGTLRSAIAQALQSDRTLDSIVPARVPGHVSSFPVGGRLRLPKLTGKRVTLSLGYVSSSPGLADLAGTIRDRLENVAGVSVHVVADDPDADLQLTDRGAWVDTAFGWLQDYLDNPLPGSSAKLAELEKRARSTDKQEVRLVALGEIQKQAAADNTVLPVSQSAGVLFVAKNADLVGEAFGPNWQLALWGARWRS